MIESDELLVAICGDAEVAIFKTVKGKSMRLARAVKEVIAEELDGNLPSSGKQFLSTSRGTFRLATRANSDNSTEEAAHRRMGAVSVQVFGEVDERHRERGWISLEDLYQRHGLRLREQQILRKLATRL